MIKICVIGAIGSGKSFVARKFGFPVFNADLEVANLYLKNKSCFIKLKKKLPKYFNNFPVNKNSIIEAILANNSNLKKIIKIVHPEIKKKTNIFINKNKNKKIVVLDIPLLLENKINKKKDIIVFVDANKVEIIKRLKKRENFNKNLLKKFKKIQLPLQYKKKKSNFILKNDFTKLSVKKGVMQILKKILKNIKK
jgi:dephospho-CoA kinase